MPHLIRLLMRFLLVPLGYLAASAAATMVLLAVSSRLADAAFGGDPDGPAIAFFGLAISAPLLLIFVAGFLLQPVALGILISEAFAIRSWVFHALNGALSAWVGWQLHGPSAGEALTLNPPLAVVAAGIVGGFAYWIVAGSSAGFYKPIFLQHTTRATAR
ncbi:MAG: hypothetical protein IT536_17780 [Hyphomicrobiales bacterium]|nr:hypothetical protein [Hyphomicrobiales bacterium]